jgi:hypothetical protein
MCLFSMIITSDIVHIYCRIQMVRRVLLQSEMQRLVVER